MYGFSKETHETAERIIRDEIFCCDSSLVDELCRIDFLHWEDIQNLQCSHCEGLDDSDCDYCGGNGYQEPFEWWRVSSYLCEKLNLRGEPIIDNDYGQWWGRTCTGQSIILDGTIQQIVESTR